MEQKDRMHTINHFKHLRDTDPVEAERVRQQTRDHLAIIDQRMQQSVEMLNRVPDFAKKIKVGRASVVLCSSIEQSIAILQFC